MCCVVVCSADIQLRHGTDFLLSKQPDRTGRRPSDGAAGLQPAQVDVGEIKGHTRRNRNLHSFAGHNAAPCVCVCVCVIIGFDPERGTGETVSSGEGDTDVDVMSPRKVFSLL